jgi:hypothetical protein
MAYRHRYTTVVKYGHFNDVASVFHQLNEIAAARGWAQSRILVPFVGTNNEISVETEYADLATFEREMDAFYSDAEAMKVWRSAADYMVEGSSRDALYCDAPTLA